MAVATEKLKTELAGLTEHERADLAHFLLRSLDDPKAGADAEIEGAWDAELVLRADEIQRGEATGKPANQVFAELREKHS